MLDLQMAVVSVPGGGAVNVQPAVGQSWYVIAVNSAGSITPNVYDGTHEQSQLFPAWKEGAHKMSINNSVYLRWTNSSGGALSGFYAFHRQDDVVSVTTKLRPAGGGYVNVQPTVGEIHMYDILYAEIGSGFHVMMHDGTNSARYGTAGESGSRLENLAITVTNAAYLRVKNNSAGAVNLWLSGKKEPSSSGFNTEALMGTVPASGSLNVQPSPGVIKLIRAFATWPETNNDILQAHGYNGTLQATFNQPAQNSAPITNSVYLRLTNGHPTAKPYGYALITIS